MGLLCDAEYNLTCKYGNHTEIEQICQLESKMGKNVELSFIHRNQCQHELYIYMYISATDHQKGISMQMTSTTPATSLFISLHTNNTLYLSSSIPPLQRQLANYYTSTLQSPSAAKCSNLVPPSLHQKTNLSMGLMYCYMLYVHVMRKPASHLSSSL